MIKEGNKRRRISCFVSNLIYFHIKSCNSKMLFYARLLVLVNLISSLELLDKNRNCPVTCTCQLEHLTETAIYRFIQNGKNKETTQETKANSFEFNEVLYDDNLESELLEDKQIVRSAICILSEHIETIKLIDSLPEDLEALALIQGFNTGSKLIKFSYLEKFKNLLSLELLGPNMLNQKINNSLIIEIDTPLSNLKFTNLENIIIKTSKLQIQNLVKETSKNEQTFEYVQKIDSRVHPLTMIQKNEEVLPYEKYIQQDNENKIPLFIGFKNLFLLRITNCDLNKIHWTMFDGLQNLQYLILDNNNLKFIPPFAFYGTPNLKTLSLAHNNLLDIQITDLAGLLELEYLDLSYNNFSKLSELSLPPFPKLKLANFGNNPIRVIFPNTFEVMNTTDSLIIGSDTIELSLMPNSFTGLHLLKALTLNNLNIKLLNRELFTGMPNLKELILTGNITKIEYDTFLEVRNLKKLILTNCNIQNISMDAFIGLGNLEILDLSKNQLEQLPPAVFDQLINIKEIYLNNNKLTQLPRDIFSKIHVKMIRLNENPWHCSCEMSEWKPIIINRIKQKIIKTCDFTHDKGIGCMQNNRFTFKYIYENKVAPKCAEPQQYLNWSVFHVMRRLLKCPEYKPKIKKVHHLKKNHTEVMEIKTTSIEITTTKFDLFQNNLIKNEPEHQKFIKHKINNNLNTLYRNDNQIHVRTKLRKMKKYKKHVTIDNNII